MKNVEFEDFYNYFTADYTDEEIEIAFKRIKAGYNEFKVGKQKTYSINGINYSNENLKGAAGKNFALNLCKENYIRTARNVNYVSDNENGLTYWINPDATRLSDDWTIIINNIEERKLYVFFIPAYTFSVSDFKTRMQHQLQLDIQIDVSSVSFQDTRSKIRFAPYKVAELTY
jgi:hypothetical protein